MAARWAPWFTSGRRGPVKAEQVLDRELGEWRASEMNKRSKTRTLVSL